MSPIRSSRCNPTTRVPIFEAIEPRQLLSASLSGGTLSLLGTESNDRFVLRMKGSKVEVLQNNTSVGLFNFSAISKINAVLGAGNDALDSSAVNKPIAVHGDAGNDTLTTGNSNDTLYGGSGNDQLSAKGGADRLYGDSGNDGLDGGDGNDTLNGGAGNDNLLGQAGFDYADYSTHTAGVKVTLDGVTNDGSPGEKDFVGSTIEGVFGSNYNDSLIGSSRNESFFGRGGNDLINGNAGDDSMEGGTGNDILYGGAGNDLLLWDFGSDTLQGAEGIDTVDYRKATGGVRISLDMNANDGTSNGSERDNVWIDNEIIHGTNYADHITGSDVVNIIHGYGGSDSLNGAGGNDAVYGGSGNDTLFGAAGNDTLRGDSGNDDLYGGAGSDKLYGGSGNDGLFGGPSADTLTGEGGSDRFLDNLLVGTTNWYRQDTRADLSSVDVALNFYDSYNPLVFSTGPAVSKAGQYKSAKWSESDVIAVDSALGVIHRTTGSPLALGFSVDSGGALGAKLWRLGNRITSGGSSNAAFWGSLDSQPSMGQGLFFTPAAFNSTSAARSATLSAVGEMVWQKKLSNTDRKSFDALSGWVYDSGGGSAHKSSKYQRASGNWYHLKTAKFVNATAARWNADDFAQTWSRYFHNAAGWSNTFSNVPVKTTFVQNIVNRF